VLLNSHVSANARRFAGTVCSPVQSIWGTSLGEDKLGASARTLNTQVARRVRYLCIANIPPMPEMVQVIRAQDSDVPKGSPSNAQQTVMSVHCPTLSFGIGRHGACTHRTPNMSRSVSGLIPELPEYIPAISRVYHCSFPECIVEISWVYHTA
jgi:hypothetical protein